jgi:hypothetical protein
MTCTNPTCERILVDGDNFCPSCGTPRGAGQPMSETQADLISLPLASIQRNDGSSRASESFEIICHKCTTHYSSDKIMCPKCYEVLIKEWRATCPRCSSVVHSDDNRVKCMVCGGKLLMSKSIDKRVSGSNDEKVVSYLLVCNRCCATSDVLVCVHDKITIIQQNGLEGNLLMLSWIKYLTLYPLAQVCWFALELILLPVTIVLVFFLKQYYHDLYISFVHRFCKPSYKWVKSGSPIQPFLLLWAT